MTALMPPARRWGTTSCEGSGTSHGEDLHAILAEEDREPPRYITPRYITTEGQQVLRR